MTIYQAGALNATSLIVPDLAVVIQSPDVSQLNGAPSNIVGIVGSASWGPLNAPVTIGAMADYAAKFGPIKARKFDMGTLVACAVLQGANNFRCVRISDGTDAAASVVVQTSCITFTSKYTGSLANADKVTLGPGSQLNTYKAVVTRPGLAPEVFDNLAAGLSGNAVWVAIATAINNGQSGVRGPSQLIVASAGAGTTAPATATVSLAGGLDGASGVDQDDLIGADTTTRSGMYALRKTGCSVAALADCDVSSTWTTQVAFGLSEGVYMILVAAAGIAVANGSTGAVDVLAAAGIDSYAYKLLMGDWCYFNDSVNGQVRLVSPQGFVLGLLGNTSPQVSGLNKRLYGIVGTQRSSANQLYSDAELVQLGQARIDVITNPVPGGAYFGLRFGRNGSSNPVTHTDAYSRLTNYIAATLNAGMGRFVGLNQSVAVRREAKATLDAFFDGMWFNDMIGNADGTVPFSVQIDANNNPPNRVALGVMQADVRVQYLSVIEYFLVNLTGGQSVEINRLQTLPLAA